MLSTGDELRAPGEPLGPGEIHNSNAPMLVALSTGCGATALPPQRLRDDRAATEQALGQALEQADVAIVSGGVSVGPHDHVKPALAALGVDEVFWGVSLQPGKPTWFGTAGDKLVFGLPGNPVSAFVTFSLFARPALFALQGATERAPARQRGRARRPRSGATPAVSWRSASAWSAWTAAPSRSRTARRRRTSSPRCSAPTRWR